MLEGSGTCGGEVASGTLLRFDQLPDDPAEDLDGYASPERGDAPSAEQALTSEERVLALDCWARAILRDNPDYDIYPLCLGCH